MTELQMTGITAGYYAHQLVLDDVSLTAKPRKVTAVLGPNGSGKSTSLRVLYGLLAPREGSVLMDGRDVTHLPSDARLDVGMALLPQGRSTFPGLTVHENLELGGWVLRRDRSAFRAALDRTYERYPALRDLPARLAGSLSGGQQRMLEIARMMMTDPQVVLIDEPSVGLAPKLAEQVYDEIARLRDEHRTILLVDQNVQAAVDLADYVYTLEMGRNHIDGAREDFANSLDGLIREWLRL
jgi:branched-chain amino acid transport system ATP-binding protein